MKDKKKQMTVSRVMSTLLTPLCTALVSPPAAQTLATVTIPAITTRAAAAAIGVSGAQPIIGHTSDFSILLKMRIKAKIMLVCGYCNRDICPLSMTLVFQSFYYWSGMNKVTAHKIS